MSRLPLLISEKIQLSARQHNPNAFVGIIKSKMPFYPNIKILNLAYQQLISKRANLNIIFKRNEKTFYKQLHPIAFLGVRQFKDQTEIEHWQKKEFNVALGPLHELGIFPSKKSWIRQPVLYFKFSHLIMDGFSLLYFFNDLYSLYQSYLSDQLVPSILSDFTTYQIVTEKYLSLEKETYLIKKDFWKNYLKKNISKLPHQKDFYDYDSVTKSFVLSKRYVKNIYSFRKRHDIDVLSLFTSIYYKALQNIFDITTVRLRVASSLRHHLKSPSERRLLASLACSFPLIINASNKKEHSLIAHANKVQIKNLVQHLPLNPLPWNQDDFKSFSALKERYLTLSLSCFVYRKNGFLTSRQEFHWVESLMDMILMIGISKESIYLIFSYKKNIFDDLEVKKLYKQIKEEVYAL